MPTYGRLAKNIAGLAGGLIVLGSAAGSDHIWRNYHIPMHRNGVCVMDQGRNPLGITYPFDDMFSYTMNGAEAFGSVAALSALRGLRRKPKTE